jgi:site-specific DNA recombinase
MRAAIYTRVSTTGQELDGHSLEEQERQCKQLLEFQGHELVKVYSDVGSGGSFEHRPGYRQMLEEMNKEWDMVYVWKLDRLNRSLRNSIMFFEMLGDKDAYISCITEQVDTSNPMGRFIINIMSSLAQMEREQTRERVIMGSEAARRAGRWTGGVPYGYEIPIKVDMTGNRIERGILTPHAEEAPIVQKIFELRAEGLKVSSICNRLVEEGIRTRHGNLIWNQNTVSGILKRSELYIKGYNESNGEAIWDPIVFLEETEALALGLIGADLSWLSPDVAEDLEHGLEEE